MSRRTQDTLRRKRSFGYGAVTLYGATFPDASPTSFLCNSNGVSYNPMKASLQVWALSVSLAATQEIDFSFSSSGYLDVSVPRVCLLVPYVFRYGYHSIKNGGFPHSDILGSKLTYSSPRRFAVRRVLLRLLVPRHSPCALSNLTNLAADDFRISSSISLFSVSHVRLYAPSFENSCPRSTRVLFAKCI